MFGGQETLILNANNKLVQYVLENGDTDNTKSSVSSSMTWLC